MLIFTLSIAVDYIYMYFLLLRSIFRLLLIGALFQRLF